MNKLKKYYVILMFFALGLIIIFPLVLTKINNRILLNKATTIDVPEDVLYIKNNGNTEFNTIEKLKTFLKATEEKNGIVTVKTKDLLDEEETKTLVKRIEEQVQIMQDKGVIGELNFSEDYKVEYLTQKNYIDSLDPTNYLSVWNIHIKYDDFQIAYSVDVQSFLIYQFSIDTENKELSSTFKSLKPERFFDYLGLSFKEFMAKKDDRYSDDYYTYEYYLGDGYYISYITIADKFGVYYWAHI